MRNRMIGMVCLIAVLGAGIFWWLRVDVSQPVRTPALDAQPAASTASAEAQAKPAEGTTTISSVPAAQSPEPETQPVKTDGNNPFRVDSTGKLVLDEQTRLNMEALFAENDRAQLPEAQQNATAKLPPAAMTEASALLERYDNYSKEQRQSYPPGLPPSTEEAALAELDGLHALRVAHFGPEVAKALYGAEEEITRSLIDLMRLEKNQSLTVQEKAERAQKLQDEIASRQQERP
jgi:hypothetical protein